MTERVLQEQTRQLLVLLQNKGEILEFYHTHTSKFSQAGYPDWTIVITRRQLHPVVVWIELKMPGKKLTDAQQRWQKVLDPWFAMAYDLEDFCSLLKGWGVKI